MAPGPHWAVTSGKRPADCVSLGSFLCTTGSARVYLEGLCKNLMLSVGSVFPDLARWFHQMLLSRCTMPCPGDMVVTSSLGPVLLGLTVQWGRQPSPDWAGLGYRGLTQPGGEGGLPGGGDTNPETWRVEMAWVSFRARAQVRPLLSSRSPFITHGECNEHLLCAW